MKIRRVETVPSMWMAGMPLVAPPAGSKMPITLTRMAAPGRYTFNQLKKRLYCCWILPDRLAHPRSIMHSSQIARRTLLQAALGGGAFFLLPQLARAADGADGGEPVPFSFEWLTGQARELAEHDYQPP